MPSLPSRDFSLNSSANIVIFQTNAQFVGVFSSVSFLYWLSFRQHRGTASSNRSPILFWAKPVFNWLFSNNASLRCWQGILSTGTDQSERWLNICSIAIRCQEVRSSHSSMTGFWNHWYASSYPYIRVGRNCLVFLCPQVPPRQALPFSFMATRKAWDSIQSAACL